MNSRFSVIYSIAAKNEEEAHKLAEATCVEQTIEFPYELVTDKFIKNQIVGKIKLFEKKGNKFFTEISYLDQTTGGEFTQFLNVVFGNTSLKPGIRVEKIFPSKNIFKIVKGPRFGIRGLRTLTKATKRPLLCSALKPMGTSTSDLADLATKFTLGGIDIIKDDHGLANQPFSPFKERVASVAKAVRNANKKTGGHTLYAPNITADGSQTIERAHFAKKAGALALVISSGLCGLETMRQIAENDKIALPILTHPAFHGSYVINPDSGFSHYAFYGQLMRLCGADITIFPNFGGRFSFSKEECNNVASGCRDRFGSLKPILPGPGGGMTLDKIPGHTKFYGNDVVFLMGGGLIAAGLYLIDNCKLFRKSVLLQ